MKKFMVLLLVLLMTAVMFTGCGAEYKINISPYDTYNYDEYVTLPDYSGYTVNVETTEVTDEDVDFEINSRLAEAGTQVEVTEGQVGEGDTVTISYKGTLEDGTTVDGMSAENQSLVLGSGTYIEGFESGLYGHSIGETVTLDLNFPDPYPNNTELSGKGVTFEVTIVSKTESQQAELNEEFFKTNSEGEAKTEEEYREYIRNTLQTEADEQAIYDAKSELYQQILDNSEILKYPEDEVEKQLQVAREQYQGYATSSGMNWEDFVASYFGDEETFNSQLHTYVESQIGSKLVIFALCNKEGIKVSDKEYSDQIKEYMDGFGVKDAEEFETYYGTPVQEYMEMYEVPTNMYLDKVLDKLYDQLKGNSEAAAE